jgi:hypothetical protein
LIVTVEMVNYDGVLENQLARAGTANETDHENQQRYRVPLHRAAVRPCFSTGRAADLRPPRVTRSPCCARAASGHAAAAPSRVMNSHRFNAQYLPCF